VIVAVSVTWEIERRLIYVDFAGDVTVEEVAQASDTVTQYIWDGQAPVHVVANLIRVERYPREFRKLADAIPHQKEPNLGKTVLVGTHDPLLQLIISVIRQVVRIDLRMVKSMEEAFAYLHEADPTLPEDQPS
jgi:hypothetical protein